MSTKQRKLHTQAMQVPLNFSIEDETLKTFVEYALILGLVVVLVIVAFVVLGPTPSAVTTLGPSVLRPRFVDKIWRCSRGCRQRSSSRQTAWRIACRWRGRDGSHPPVDACFCGYHAAVACR